MGETEDVNEIICRKMICVDDEGITIEEQEPPVRIRFEECARNYAAENGLQESKCVAARDITTLSFVFYTVPKTKVVFKRHFLKDLITGKSAVNKFTAMQNAIGLAGYTGYDLS